jgi:purine-binding chemotaxis protein CheW
MEHHDTSTVFPGTSAHRAASAAQQYLTFRLGAEEYAMHILQVQEIRSYEQPISMVNTPDFVKGVINLRGVIVPIVDLRIKFGLPKVDYTDFTIVIVLNIASVVIGAVVDAVADVVTLTAEQIKPSPQFESAIDARFIRGIANVENRTLIAMDMDVLMNPVELGMAAKA